MQTGRQKDRHTHAHTPAELNVSSQKIYAVTKMD